MVELPRATRLKVVVESPSSQIIRYPRRPDHADLLNFTSTLVRVNLTDLGELSA